MRPCFGRKSQRRRVQLLAQRSCAHGLMHQAPDAFQNTAESCSVNCAYQPDAPGNSIPWCDVQATVLVQAHRPHSFATCLHAQVENLKAIISAEIGIHRDAMTLWCEGHEMQDRLKLSDTSAKQDSLVYVRRAAEPPQPAAQPAMGGGSARSSMLAEQVPGF